MKIADEDMVSEIDFDSSFTLNTTCHAVLGRRRNFSFNFNNNSPMMVVPMFCGSSLRLSLSRVIETINSTPIEHFEVKLFKLTQIFHSQLGGIEFSLSFIGDIHHLISLQSRKVPTSEFEATAISELLTKFSNKDPYIFLRYKLTRKLFKLASGLAVKWKIFELKKYEFRFSGRGLNVRLLDMEKLNEDIFSMDVFWFSYSFLLDPLNDVATEGVIEVGKILKNNTEALFEYLMSLNPYRPDCNISEIVAFKSKKYRDYKKYVVPKMNIEGIRYQTLNFSESFLVKCFRDDPVLDELHLRLANFEVAYRMFEKEAIIALMSASSL